MIRSHTLLLLSATMFSQLSAADELRFAASDLLAEHIKPIVERYSDAHDFQVEMNSIGSLPALDRLRSDEIDVAIVAVPDDAATPSGEFVVYPFAYAISVVVVNTTNPTNELSLSELGGIYGASEELKLNTWGELGYTGWSNRYIKPIALQNPDSISLELFKHQVFKGNEMKSGVSIVKPKEVESQVSGDSDSIGVISHVPKAKSLKVVMVSKEADLPAYGPSQDNVHFGDYPVRLPFYIVFDERDAARMDGLLRALFSDEMAEVLEANNLVSLPLNVRRKLLIDLDLKK